MTNFKLEIALVDLEEDRVLVVDDLEQAKSLFYFWLLLGKDPRAIRVFSNVNSISEDFFQLINNEV